MNSNNYKHYVEWKNWGEKFGKIDDIKAKYYDLELAEVFNHYDNNRSLRVLEIGFGNGEFLGYGLKKGWDIYGVEINQYLIDIAIDNGFNAVNSLDELPDDFFDLIVGFDVIEHISSNEICSFLEKLKLKLKNKGLFLFRFPNGDSPIGLKNQNGDLTHLHVIGSEKILQICKITQLKLIVIRAEKKNLKKGAIKEMVFNIISNICAKILDKIIKFIFFRNTIYIFSSENLVAVLEKQNVSEDVLRF